MNVRTSGKVVHDSYYKRGYRRTACGYSERDTSGYWEETKEKIQAGSVKICMRITGE